eukprot:4064988-Pleurochrysis_carterae.AAC.1
MFQLGLQSTITTPPHLISWRLMVVIRVVMRVFLLVVMLMVLPITRHLLIGDLASTAVFRKSGPDERPIPVLKLRLLKHWRKPEPRPKTAGT